MSNSFKVGDTGVTLNGLHYKITSIDMDQEPYPLEVYLFEEGGDVGYFTCYTLSGNAYANETSAYDLIPVTREVIPESVLPDNEDIDYILNLDKFDIMINQTGHTNTLIKNFSSGLYSLHTHSSGAVYPDLFAAEGVEDQLRCGNWIFIDDAVFDGGDEFIDYSDLHDAIENYLDAYRAAEHATEIAFEAEQEMHMVYSRLIHDNAHSE
jgi:hypothetical protein